LDIVRTFDGPTIAASNANLIVERGPAGPATQEEVVEQLRTNWGTEGTITDRPGADLGGHRSDSIDVARVNEFDLEIRQTTHVVVRDSFYYIVILSRIDGDDRPVPDFDAALASWTWTD
jgi:hypothetical protein